MSQPSPALSVFHPLLAGWFARTFGQPTDVQLQAWASIREDRHTLIAAPTGSGKTLAALLPCLDRIARAKLAAADRWTPGVRTVYVTPLKALNNDIQHHLTGFMAAIERYAAEQAAPSGAEAWPGIQTAVRTGDTPSKERARMTRRPPDVLVTTPESLYLLVTSAKGREMLQTVETVIVDEIHGIAGDKRGVHLSLTLERLTVLRKGPVQRIGISATQKPMTRMARFLGGWAPADAPAATDWCERDPDLLAAANPHLLGYLPRPVKIIESMMAKTMQVRVTMPDFTRLAKSREALWTPIVERLLQLMEGARSVLLFVNSRRLCERLVLRLNEQAGDGFARAHHGSLARERRLEVEQQLKAGELRCLVATSSLELGIDVGHVDLVLQVDPPMDAASGIQRIGRAGHAVGDVSRGVIVARSRGQLPDAAVLCRNIVRREIEPIELPYQPIDVLSQQIVAIAAADAITVDELYALIVGSECYRQYPREELTAVLQVLAGFYPFARPLIDWDRERDVLSRRAASPIAAVTGVGTIPQSSAYPVHHADSRIHLGELDEEYIHESRVGDVFQLGTSSWMISRIEHDRVYVQEAANRFSEIPFWRNEPGGRRALLGVQLGQFLQQLTEQLALGRRSTEPASEEDDKQAVEDTITWLDVEYGLDRIAAEQLIDLIEAQHRALGVPTEKHIIIEHYRDFTNQHRIIIHNPFGRKLNRTWLLAIEQQFGAMLPYKLYGNAKDNGIELVVPDGDTSWLNALWHIAPGTLEPLLAEAIAGSPMLGISFRRIAETSLLLSRSFTRTPMWQKRLRSEELLKQALPYAEHFPYLREAMKESLHTYLDAAGLKGLLRQIAEGQIEVTVKETNAPSPFAAQFIADYVNTQIYEGDGLGAATQLQLLGISKSMASSLFGHDAVQASISPEAMEAEEQRLAAGGGTLQLRSMEDVYRLLKRKGDLSLGELQAHGDGPVTEWAAELEQAGRLARLSLGADSTRYICADEALLYEAFPAQEQSVIFIVGRYADNRISFTVPELRERYPLLTEEQTEQCVQTLLQRQLIEPAPFAQDESDRIWTSRSIAQRLIRLTIDQARKQAEPASPVRWCSEISQLQHVLAGTQLAGIDGLREVLRQLQGFFIPASHWESIILPSRLTGYRKEDLDMLCASGEVIWIGRKEEQEKEGRIAFFFAESRPLYTPYITPVESRADDTKHPELLTLLRSGGASFLTRLSRDAGKPPSELLASLMELVWEGQVSNDQFAPLRIYLQTKGKHARTGSGLGRWYWTGDLASESYDPLEGEAPHGDVISASLPVPKHAAAAHTQAVLHWTQHLLDSCGIVSKELVAQVAPYGWDELLPVLKQLEQLGIVTRGLLLSGAASLQFARRELITSVQQPLPGETTSPVTLLSAVDPANPFGVTAEWPQMQGANFARKSGNYLVLQQKQWRYWIENNGRKVVELKDDGSVFAAQPDYAGLKQIFRTVLNQQGISKIKIDRWNGEEVIDSPAAEPLRSLGAERDNRSLVLWPSNLQ
ncbi:ATP-dependent Lhr-like helicase [Paenibacillus phyllosphaerae]|uniref:ATP-dependent Lhr-like helicase n=1 Tax=Paenibacillus phyllosphaerae TaxID=274593 RepID=A0A7W5B3P5_9BACL|nr:DEAD/DEAH box helicase [Paenibacillus phyllosphaerae]MBB3113850.1 ATP-dependent Lhr-like helicase [Paenibacillus phyllosphaerae]